MRAIIGKGKGGDIIKPRTWVCTRMRFANLTRRPHPSCVNSVIVSEQIWKHRCTELIYSMPRERSTNKGQRPRVLSFPCHRKSATTQFEGLHISLQFLLLHKINAVQPKGDILML